MTQETIVHLLRHGEVHNPTGILYGRRPGFQLSDLGRQMAQRVADTIADRDITHVPVVDGSKLIGIVARGDLVRFLSRTS